jgi:hypothetical protein
MSTSQVVVPSHNTTDLSLSTEVMLLHEQVCVAIGCVVAWLLTVFGNSATCVVQVALWKEDFEKERADREKAQSELDTVRKVSLEDRSLLHKERDTVLDCCYSMVML